jgi:hypothetical protein
MHFQWFRLPLQPVFDPAFNSLWFWPPLIQPVQSGPPTSSGPGYPWTSQLDLAFPLPSGSGHLWTSQLDLAFPLPSGSGHLWTSQLDQALLVREVPASANPAQRIFDRIPSRRVLRPQASLARLHQCRFNCARSPEAWDQGMRVGRPTLADRNSISTHRAAGCESAPSPSRTNCRQSDVPEDLFATATPVGHLDRKSSTKRRPT